ncbi:30S ribosomal protein S9 [Candidatus Parvarchaeota archaeon]|uniref:30S ribosomal protein S9 n=1 Tax=Candidatus Acidifodinimicrobium mancum TaxID=2898728 RepID=A0A8T3UYG1_9ARCH|nr:30S ribosomal protein S9 [Candidatus Acidifodinimicrobium mancum]MBE5728248.1 30S ribosomal protein S9 [Candidatus Acidifodinimicrobium mancum]MBE5729862.1 30S ribosomal protein S9 [Candidatus Acidifodinimicrobium mancum]
MSKVNVFTAKRKTTVARGVIEQGDGSVYINSKSLDAYNDKLFKMMVTEPIILSGDTYKKYSFKIFVTGGGNMARATAVRAVIAKALSSKEKSLRKVFLSYDRTLLVDDKRVTEPQKPYRSAARALKQTSYR